MLDKIKEIKGTEKIDNAKILADTLNTFPDDITLKNAVILIARVIKHDDNIQFMLL